MGQASELAAEVALLLALLQLDLQQLEQQLLCLDARYLSSSEGIIGDCT